MGLVYRLSGILTLVLGFFWVVRVLMEATANQEWAALEFVGPLVVMAVGGVVLSRGVKSFKNE